MIRSFKASCNSALIALIVVSALFTGIMLTSVPSAFAQTSTISELQKQIAELQERIKSLQSKSQTGGTSTPGNKITVDTDILTTDTVRVRSGSGLDGRVLSTQPSGVEGKVIDGPRSQNGYNWYKVDFVSGSDGWVAGGWFKNRISPSKPTASSFEASISGLVATVSFTLSNGCGGYVIHWGDGEKTELAGSAAGSQCTMALVTVSKEHTYTKAGTYTVKVERYDGQTFSDTSKKEIKVGSDSRPTIPGIISCLNGAESYKEGSKRTSITNTDGSRSVVTDGSYVCRNGKWIIEGSLPKPTDPIGVASVMCVSGGKTYAQNEKLNTIVENGVTQSVKDASFVCRNGKWIIEGSLPKPINPECVKGKPRYVSTTGRTTAECLDVPDEYSLADVRTITKQVVASPSLVFPAESYTVYTITLKNDRKIEVKIAGLMTASIVEAEFRKTGFGGSVDTLMNQAKEVTVAMLKSCTLKSALYKHGETAKFAQTSSSSLSTRVLGSSLSTRPSSGALVTHMCQNGEWKVSTSDKPSSITNTSTSDKIFGAGAVHGVSIDILSQLSAALTAIENILQREE